MDINLPAFSQNKKAQKEKNKSTNTQAKQE